MILAAVVAVIAVVATALIAVRHGRGWQTVWSDHFDGAAGSLPSSKDWAAASGTSYPGGAAQWGTGEIQTYTSSPANIGLDGEGNLRITPIRDAAGAWTSARIETLRDDFEPAPGEQLKMEARLKLPDGGQGYWAAFWALGAPFRPTHATWPASGEIDVMEAIGSEPATVHGTLHCGVFDGGPCQETTGLGAASTGASSSLSSEFHTYSVVWDRSLPTEEMRWLRDGEVFHTVRATDVDSATWAQATDHGFYLLLNVAIGGNWPGLPTADTVAGRSMIVDQVSVQRKG